MSKSKDQLSEKEHKSLIETYRISFDSGHPLSVRQLAKMFKCNQPRILKELNLWKGMQRDDGKAPVISLVSSSMDEVRKEYGETI